MLSHGVESESTEKIWSVLAYVALIQEVHISVRNDSNNQVFKFGWRWKA